MLIVTFWFRGLQWPAIAARFVGAMAPMAAWVTYLSYTAQQFVLPSTLGGVDFTTIRTAAAMESAVVRMGIWSPPLRELAVSFQPHRNQRWGLSVWAGLQWLGTNLLTPSSICLLLGATIGLFRDLHG